MKLKSKNTTLIIIDVQNDFCPGGSLEVKNGDQIVKPINGAQSNFDEIIITQDWHPQSHKCFAINHGLKEYSTIELPYGPQILWPEHCVQNTKGASLNTNLNTSKANLILRKGSNNDIDSYSAFFENDKKTSTGLVGYLKSKDIESIYLCGLAFDFCVFYSAIDAVKLGFNVYVIENLTKSIDLNSSKDTAKKAMLEQNIKLINF